MEDDLKIFKLEYRSDHLSDLPQILNTRLSEHTKIENCLKWRQPQMKDDLKILKLEYLSNHLSDLPHLFKLKLLGPIQN
jgi:hypothetical protein